MRGRVCGALVVAVSLAWTSIGLADERAEALKIVDAAIQAAGGEAKLAKLQTVTLKGKGTVTVPNEEGTVAFEATVHGLDRLRLDLELTGKDNNTLKLSIGLSGDKSWIKNNDRMEDAPPEVTTLLKAEMHAMRVAQSLPLLKDKDLKLSPLGEMKIDDRAAVGIKITKKDYPDVDLYFDKETRLPLKFELRIKEPNGQEITTAWLFSAYKELAGVKHPSKVALLREGEKLLELEIGEVKPEEKVDESTFAKP